MSAVYIIVWLAFAVLVGWGVVWLSDRMHQLDDTIDHVLDEPEAEPEEAAPEPQPDPSRDQHTAFGGAIVGPGPGYAQLMIRIGFDCATCQQPSERWVSRRQFQLILSCISHGHLPECDPCRATLARLDQEVTQ